MDVICPSCRSRIAPDDINVATDVALCRSCGNTFRLSEIIGAVPSSSIDPGSPPSGAWFEPLPDGFRAGATTRNWFAIFIVPFTCVWSGGSLGGIYGTQIAKGHFALGPSLFGIPFLIGSCFLISWCVMSVAGQVVITRNLNQLSIFTGVGPIGWTRHYAFSDFRTAREDFSRYTAGWNRNGGVIRLEGQRGIGFGSMLTTERRYFLIGILRSALSGQTVTSGFATAPRFR
ncbi:MAG TPA: hypothetical protein VKR52_18205 [Terracidiphilus sp.]|nr:hypothetical protein [Terracidiphilus sp.]